VSNTLKRDGTIAGLSENIAVPIELSKQPFERSYVLYIYSLYYHYLEWNYKAGIKTRSDSKVKTTNCQARNMAVTRQQANIKSWNHSVSYGHRWMAEIVFSSIKRMLGEHVTARKFPYMVKEIF